MRRRRIGLVAAGPLLVLALGVVGACGKATADGGIATAGGAQPTAGASSSGTDGDLRKFTQCMRDNGVDMPDPDPETDRPDFGAIAGVNRDAIQKAMQACRSLLPNGGVRPTLDAAGQEQLRQFAQCMRDNGVDMPDPDPNAGGLGLRGGNRQFDRNNPTFQKAMEACQSKLPQFRGGRNS
jgi:hypothetical protein